MAAPAQGFGDTDAKTAELYVELHRKMTPGERLTRVFEMCEFHRGLGCANVRGMYPEALEQELRYHLAARIYGRDLARRAYGPAPDEDL